MEVDNLKRQLEEMQPVLIRTSKEVEQMMEQIEKDKAEADDTRAVVVKEEAVASTKAEECQQIKVYIKYKVYSLGRRSASRSKCVKCKV